MRAQKRLRGIDIGSGYAENFGACRMIFGELVEHAADDDIDGVGLRLVGDGSGKILPIERQCEP